MPEPDARWVMVLPVKRLRVAKSRLGGPYADRRAALALAFALDTAAAALAADDVRGVVAVTDEAAAGAELRDLGVVVVPDEPAAGLNPALLHGAATARARHPQCGLGALSADLPALRPAELDRALALAGRHAGSFVRDVHGNGTTLLLARPDVELQPAFGTDSAVRHLAAGHVELTDAGLDSLRQDVDSADDLAAAVHLGLGPRTAAVLDR